MKQNGAESPPGIFHSIPSKKRSHIYWSDFLDSSISSIHQDNQPIIQTTDPSPKKISNSIRLSCQLLVTLIPIFNQWVEYRTHLFGKSIYHAMITLIHLMSHCHYGIRRECWHCMGTKFHSHMGWHGLRWLPMADQDTKIGKYVFATLSTNVA